MAGQSLNVVWSADYVPFSQADVALASIENNLRFAGQYYDQETGLHYNYFRYYDPKLGRYLRADPIGFNGGVNLYVYAKNNPLKFIDPNGLNVFGKISCGLAARQAIAVCGAKFQASYNNI